MNGGERFLEGVVVKCDDRVCVCVGGRLEGLLQRSERQNQKCTGPDSHLSFIMQWGEIEG